LQASSGIDWLAAYGSSARRGSLSSGKEGQMTKLQWTPWHKVVRIRPDLKSGELSLNIFAADLYDVAMGKAKPVYQDAREFFSLTYPTSICANWRGMSC
jgi:hypothetical protein